MTQHTQILSLLEKRAADWPAEERTVFKQLVCRQREAAAKELKEKIKHDLQFVNLTQLEQISELLDTLLRTTK